MHGMSSKGRRRKTCFGEGKYYLRLLPLFGPTNLHLLGRDDFAHYLRTMLEIQPQASEDSNRSALSEANQAKEQVFGSNEVVVKSVGLHSRQGQRLLNLRTETGRGLRGTRPLMSRGRC
jgi:hypothetical protein